MTTSGTSTPNSRRRFLALSGGAVAGAVVLSACGTDVTANSSGTVAPTSVPPTAPPVTASAAEKAADAVILRTAASLELSIVAAYGKLTANPLLTDGTVKTWLTRLSANHQSYADQLNQLATDVGGKAYTKTNESVDNELVAPAVGTAASGADLLALAVTLERAAFANLALEVGSLKVTAGRGPVMAISAAEARNAAALSLLGDSAAAPDAFAPRRDALGVDAEVG